MHLLRFFWFCGFEINTLLYPSILCMCFFCLSSLCLSSLCVCLFHPYISHLCVFVSLIFVCLCLSSLCVSLSSLCVWFFRLYVSAFVSLLETTSFYNGYFFPSWLCGVPSFCSLVLYFGIVCVVVIFVAIFSTRSNTCFLFFLSLLYQHFHFLLSLHI